MLIPKHNKLFGITKTKDKIEQYDNEDYNEEIPISK